MTVENSDPRCFWLTNHLETLLVQVWYGSTVATLSREMKRLILEFLERTGDPALVPTKLHDFGFRGASSVESASLGGAAHLVNFEGTDTVAGCLLAQEYYDADMPGRSIPAAEHSTIMAWGPEGEREAFENMLRAYPEGTVSCVSDSWDIYRACTELWGSELRDRVLARKGTLVVRPDSGDPPAVVTRVLDLLGEAFGAERNEKGFKVLAPQVRVIQGDGIDYAMAREILSALERAGWSADNVTFGMGGGLLQKLDRDTHEFAFKCSEVGRLKLVRTASGGYETVPERAPGEDLLREVFRDGRVTLRQGFEEIRRRAALSRSR
jgi:nicotinamide phosphoribosyltransferase